jgi:hypothetical protein
LRIRKNVIDLTADERSAFVNAVKAMKGNDANSDGTTDYDEFVTTHRTVGFSCGPVYCAHQGAGFLPWHRQFLWDFETALLAADTSGELTGLPYWEWSVDNYAPQDASVTAPPELSPWSVDLLGGNGGTFAQDRRVLVGPFRDGEWNPVGNTAVSQDYLQRRFNIDPTPTAFQDLFVLAGIVDSGTVTSIVTHPTRPYDSAPYSGHPANSFRSELESVHNSVHVAVGGHMTQAVSPDDPVFFLHHSEIDRIWSRWQAIHGFENYNPSSTEAGPNGTNLSDAMLPFGVPVHDMFDTMGPILNYTYAPRRLDFSQSRDIVLVMDTSGSMSGSTGTSGLSKMDAAKNAANTFIDLVEVGAGHRVGIVEFTTNATVVAPLMDVPGDKTNLRNAVNALGPTDLTSIGDGLALAFGELTSAPPSTNHKSILLYTDGRENAEQSVADVQATLGNTRVDVLGFGTGTSLNSQQLANLAEDQQGIYAEAPTGLQLQKFYVAAFGDVFGLGTIGDPFYSFRPRETSPTGSYAFSVGNSERELTVVVGWENRDAIETIRLRSPSGALVDAETPGVRSSDGETWAYLKVPLPIGGQRQGDWEVVAERNCEQDCPDRTDEFFVAVFEEGGPRITPANLNHSIYTGDPLVPLVSLRRPDGSLVDAKVTVDVAVPQASLGNLLQQVNRVDGDPNASDPVDSRTATLMMLEENLGEELVPTEHILIELLDNDDGSNGAWGRDGVYGTSINDITRFAGTYEILATAEFVDGVNVSRETAWSVNVEVGIDPEASQIVVSEAEDLTRIDFVPQDAFGNVLGFGRLDAFEIAFSNNESSQLLEVVDLMEGTYRIDFRWDGVSDVLVVQPGRVPQLLLQGSRLVGDFDGNGILDADDIDILSGAVSYPDPNDPDSPCAQPNPPPWCQFAFGISSDAFDLNQNGMVDAGDRLVWVKDLKQTWYGDANLDGEFNSSDLVEVLQAGEYEDDIAFNSGWVEGDWNGDSDFTSGDLVAALQDGGFEQGPLPVAVPEPTFSWAVLICLGIWACLATRRVE